MKLSETRQKIINELLNYSQYKISLNKNDVLHENIDLNNNICILLKGEYKLKYHIPNSLGKNFTVAHYKDSGLILPNFKGIDTFSQFFKVEILCKSDFAIVPLNKVYFNEMLKENIENYYYFTCKKIYLQMRDLLIYPKELAFISILIRLGNSFGIKENKKCIIDLKMSNKELAEFMGSNPETISRISLKLQKKNLLQKINTHKIILTNFEKLKELLDCEYCDQSLCEF